MRLRECLAAATAVLCLFVDAIPLSTTEEQVSSVGSKLDEAAKDIQVSRHPVNGNRVIDIHDYLLLMSTDSWL